MAPEAGGLLLPLPWSLRRGVSLLLSGLALGWTCPSKAARGLSPTLSHRTSQGSYAPSQARLFLSWLKLFPFRSKDNQNLWLFLCPQN